MNYIITFILLFFGLTLTSCIQTSKTVTIAPVDWIKLTLPNGWTLHAPKNFDTKALLGIDSKPGAITSKKDSIYLQFDSGTEIQRHEKCTFQNSVEQAKNDIENGFYKDFYKVPVLHSAYIDTIDNKIAIIIKPTKEKEGTVKISISDCETGEWLSIKGIDLTIEKEKLVLEIFKTIKLTKNN